MIKDFSVGFATIAGAALFGWGLSYPMNTVLNGAAKVLCRYSTDRVLVENRDTVFPGQIKVNCVERKYL